MSSGLGAVARKSKPLSRCCCVGRTLRRYGCDRAKETEASMSLSRTQTCRMRGLCSRSSDTPATLRAARSSTATGRVNWSDDLHRSYSCLSKGSTQ
ncbi:hypothetical protein RHA1_ro03158 [Rhodococcus jostii RHA1]|uniref:Uncharacterized protein n=1 Tax=Rhodococcus jostii (strain RHA1) TaxID=101510 RepID=Q0SBX5_RHOJR|nr:hypothetical protein RHA1_ro03158 [Rhodococcus jostii RHA1]